VGPGDIPEKCGERKHSLPLADLLEYRKYVTVLCLSTAVDGRGA
jgi:hypothetical protein